MAPVLPPIFPWYVSPATPDLGCFVRNKHPFEVDYDFFIWNEFPPFNSAGQYIPHQVYFRVKCGKAAHHQRVRVWMTPPNSDPPPLIGLPPDFVLGGAFLPTPSDWQKFPVRSGNTDYWFAGEHKPPQDSVWQRDAAVGHSFDIYDNGTLSTVGWDDTGGDRDFNDIVLEVAIVYRRNFFDDLKPFALSEKEVERFKKEILPKIRASKKAPRASAE
jgi:hypothetical protein